MPCAAVPCPPVPTQLSPVPWRTPCPTLLPLAPHPAVLCPLLFHVPWRDVGAHPWDPHPVPFLLALGTHHSWKLAA